MAKLACPQVAPKPCTWLFRSPVRRSFLGLFGRGSAPFGAPNWPAAVGIGSIPQRPGQWPSRCSRGRAGPAPPARICGCAAGPGGGAAGGWERGRERHVSLHQAPQHLPVRQERRRRHQVSEDGTLREYGPGRRGIGVQAGQWGALWMSMAPGCPGCRAAGCRGAIRVSGYRSCVGVLAGCWECWPGVGVPLRAVGVSGFWGAGQVLGCGRDVKVLVRCQRCGLGGSGCDGSAGPGSGVTALQAPPTNLPEELGLSPPQDAHLRPCNFLCTIQTVLMAKFNIQKN